MNIIKLIYKKMLYANRSSSRSYIRFLSKKGVAIGKNVTFYEPNTNYVDDQMPFLVEIGDNVEIARGAVIITHDYAWSVIKQMTGEIVGSRAKVKVGNNVFIGMNSTILKGVVVGDNVVIGANSVVTKDIPSNTVVCGNPAKPICTVDEYYRKRKEKYIGEAEQVFNAYYDKYGKVPNKEIFDEFFWIFESRKKHLNKKYSKKMALTGNLEMSCKKFAKTEPYYNGYSAFVEHCMAKRSNNGAN